MAQGETAAEKFLLRWRGEANPDHVKAIDTYWICTAEHGLNASTFTARVVASTGADCGAAMSAAVGGLSGPLHGGAPARVLPMLDEVAKTGDPEGYVKSILEQHGRIMGFGHRVYRAGTPDRESSSAWHRRSAHRAWRSPRRWRRLRSPSSTGESRTT